MIKQKTPTRIAAIMTFAAALSAPGLQADHHKTAEISDLMDRIESNALDIRHQGARLRSYTRVPSMYSWQLHADELSRAHAEVERIGELLAELKPLKPEMSKRQATAYNAILGLSVELTEAVEKAVKIVNTQREKLEIAHPDYENPVDAIYTKADTIAMHADNVEDRIEARAVLRSGS